MEKADITINGKSYQGYSINIVVDGSTIESIPLDKAKIPISVEVTGGLANLNSQLSVTVHGFVDGNIEAGGNVKCENVDGNVNAGGNVECSTIDGDTEVEGDLKCQEIDGNVTVNGNVTCETIDGDVEVSGNLKCETITGDIEAGGNVSVG